MPQSNLQAGSYALAAADAVQQRNAGTATPGQVGIAGSTAAPRPEAMERVVIDTSTSDLIMKLGAKILEPQIQKVQTAKFLEGAQRVAQGEALKDIVDEQPWITTIFGTSSSIQGARAVAQMKGVDDYLTSVASDMPNLQKLSSKEFGQKITGKMSEFLTGDSVADSAIQMKMVEATGGLFKAHTKANYKWTQDTMQGNIVGYMQSGGAKLKAMTGQLLDGTMSQSDYDDAKATYVGNLMPLDGQSPESYWGAVEGATIDALASGNHHAANAIFDSGIFNSAPTETRKKMLDARHKYEAQTQETAGFMEYGPRIGMLKGKAAAGQLTGNEILAEVDLINQDYQLRYGVDRPLFKRKEMESILSGNISSIYNRAEQDARDLAREGRADARSDAKDAAKAQMEVRKSEQLVSLVQGGAGNLSTLAGFTQPEIDRAVYQGAQVIASKGGNVGEFLVRQYNNGDAHINPLYQNQLQAGMRAAKQEGHSGQAFEQTYGMYKQISKESGGKAAAIAYLGTDDAVKMMKYDTLISGGRMQPEVAYQVSFGQVLDSSRKSTDKEIAKQIETTVSNDQPGMFSKLFGSIPLTEQSQRILRGKVGQNYDKLAGNLAMGDDEAMKLSLTVAKGELDVVGPYAYDKGTDRQPVYQMIGADEETAGKVFSKFINQRARENGILAPLPGSKDWDDNLSPAKAFVTQGPLPGMREAYKRGMESEANVIVLRLPDQGKVGMFAISVVDEHGNTTNFPVTSDEVKSFYEKSSNFK